MLIDSRINYLYRDDIKLDLEFIDVLAIEIPKDELHTKNNIIIISLYRPPSIQIKLFPEKFTDLLQFPSRENNYIFIVGDFNVDTSSAIINPNVHVNNYIIPLWINLLELMRREEHPRCWTIFTRMLLILQKTLKVDFLKDSSRITIQYFVL